MKRAFLTIAAFAVATAYGQPADAPPDGVPTAGTQSARPVPARPADAPYIYNTMTTRQKFNWTVGCIWSPTWLFYSGARAAFDQWRDDPPQWKLGAAGYARRYAAAHELEAFEDTVWFAGDVLTHEDPRYLRSGRDGFFPRLADALEVGMLSRRDNGTVGFAYARTVAGMGTEMFERIVFPDEEVFTTRTLLSDVLNYIILREAQSVGREFLPDLLKRDAARAVRNLGVPLATPVRPLPAAPPQPQQP